MHCSNRGATIVRYRFAVTSGAAMNMTKRRMRITRSSRKVAERVSRSTEVSTRSVGGNRGSVRNLRQKLARRAVYPQQHCGIGWCSQASVALCSCSRASCTMRSDTLITRSYLGHGKRLASFLSSDCPCSPLTSHAARSSSLHVAPQPQ